jgi:hypothetical protein
MVAAAHRRVVRGNKNGDFPRSGDSSVAERGESLLGRWRRAGYCMNEDDGEDEEDDGSERATLEAWLLAVRKSRYGKQFMVQGEAGDSALVEQHAKGV